jgi:hypothetical protein
VRPYFVEHLEVEQDIAVRLFQQDVPDAVYFNGRAAGQGCQVLF